MDIRELTHCTEHDFEQLLFLMNDLTPNCNITQESIYRILQSTNSHLFGLYDSERLIGTYTLGIYYSPTGSKACLEDVVLSADHRKKGFGFKMIKQAVEYLREVGVEQLLFTSNPSRKEANKLYLSMGFKQKETNVYVMKL